MSNLKKPRFRKPTLTREQLTGIIMVIPALVVLGVVYFYPLAYNIDLSLSRWQPTQGIPKTYVGLKNYIDLFSDDIFRKVIVNTVFFTAVSVPVEFFLGLGLAMLLNRNIRGRNLFTTLLSLPMIIAPVIAGISWKWLYDYDYGVINYFLSLIGAQRVLWTSDPSIVMYSIIVADIWTTTPFMMLILFAGLQMVPTQQYEAAKVDGASSWQTFWHVTLPSLKAILVVALMIRIIDAFTKLFDIVYILTGGFPFNVSGVLPIYAYRRGLTPFFNLGQGAAVSMITLMFSAVMVAVLLTLSRRTK